MMQGFFGHHYFFFVVAEKGSDLGKLHETLVYADFVLVVLGNS
jgi:hypothetical protein